jgi:hypothetical protein
VQLVPSWNSTTGITSPRRVVALPVLLPTRMARCEGSLLLERQLPACLVMAGLPRLYGSQRTELPMLALHFMGLAGERLELSATASLSPTLFLKRGGRACAELGGAS